MNVCSVDLMTRLNAPPHGQGFLCRSDCITARDPSPVLARPERGDRGNRLAPMKVGGKTEVVPMRGLIVALLILVPSLASAQGMPGGIGAGVGGTVRGAVSGGFAAIAPRPIVILEYGITNSPRPVLARPTYPRKVRQLCDGPADVTADRKREWIGAMSKQPASW